MLLTAYPGSILGPIAKILGWLMNWIYMFFENMGIQNVALTIIVFTVFIYLCLLPLTIKQQKFSVLSQKMQPEIQAVQNKYKNKKDQASMQAMQEETAVIYDKYGVSPSGSCINLFIQMPILFALYRVFMNIPAYIGNVKNILTASLVPEIMKDADFVSKMQTIYDNANLKTTRVDLSVTDNEQLSNYLVDIIYKMKSSSWDELLAAFPNLSDNINSVHTTLDKVNTFINLNISETPWDIVKVGFADKAYAICIVAALIPILSYISQVVSIKMMPTSSNGNDDNPMQQQMKMMNNVMPLFSLVLCFTVPVGLGIYWVVGAVVRAIQQFFLNKRFKQIDLDEIIEKNKERAAKRAEQRGIRREQISAAATMNTRSLSDKASMASDNESSNSNTSDYSSMQSPAYKSAPKGSLASKANLVKEFNESNKK